MDEESLDALKTNLIFRLDEIRDYVLSNIVYNLKQISEFRDFEKIECGTILNNYIMNSLRNHTGFKCLRRF